MIIRVGYGQIYLRNILPLDESTSTKATTVGKDYSFTSTPSARPTGIIDLSDTVPRSLICLPLIDSSYDNPRYRGKGLDELYDLIVFDKLLLKQNSTIRLDIDMTNTHFHYLANLTSQGNPTKGIYLYINLFFYLR